MPYITKIISGFHIDVFGHVNNARYLEFYEEARWQLYRKPIEALVKQGFALVIVNINLNYRAALNLFEPIHITAELTQVNSRSAVISQTICSPLGDKVFSDATMTWVILDQTTQKTVVLSDNAVAAQFIQQLQSTTA